MNATSFYNRLSELNTDNNVLHMPGRRMRQETDSMFRDMAYVLHLTSRVKKEILENRHESDWKPIPNR